ncbi:MAG: hypothetical protein PHY29_03150 [Syntrophales bacterium]|nr:hypothetical protein [Syntrophales bacterium]
MKKLVCVLVAGIVCLGFAGCKTEEAGSVPIAIEEKMPQGGKTMLPAEVPPVPATKEPQGELR